MTNDGGSCKLRGTDKDTLKMDRRETRTTGLDWTARKRQYLFAGWLVAVRREAQAFVEKLPVPVGKGSQTQAARGQKEQGSNPRAIASTI